MLWCSSPFVKIHTTLQVILTGAERQNWNSTPERKKLGGLFDFDLDLCLHAKQMLHISERWLMPWQLTCGLFTEIIWSDVVGNTRYASLECPLGRLSHPLMRTKSPDRHMCTELKKLNMGFLFLNKSGECLLTWIFSPCSYIYIWEMILVS